ncbi:hypothetical protein BaRGS_00007872 [Batillaria attramentaria]|uniref:Uncharacterized protein n=1 Tax=Batillaria attramentaria TaxID=370345 RepID=A0ABD0LNS7_9CAEN
MASVKRGKATHQVALQQLIFIIYGPPKPGKETQILLLLPSCSVGVAKPHTSVIACNTNNKQFPKARGVRTALTLPLTHVEFWITVKINQELRFFFFLRKTGKVRVDTNTRHQALPAKDNDERSSNNQLQAGDTNLAAAGCLSNLFPPELFFHKRGNKRNEKEWRVLSEETARRGSKTDERARKVGEERMEQKSAKEVLTVAATGRSVVSENGLLRRGHAKTTCHYLGKQDQTT